MNIRFLKKYKTEIIIFFLLMLAYWILRLTHILSLPIFTDEAIYTRWAQIAKQDASWRFISLTDGKQPLFIWLDLLAMHVIKEPLLAGRIVSAFAGFGTMIGLFFLGKEMFKSRWVGVVSAVLYVFYPFGLVYDRMALYDGLIGTFTVWSLYLEILLVRKIRLDLAFVLSFVTGAAVLNKTNGFGSIYLLPFSLLLFQAKKKDRQQKLFKWIALTIVVTILTFVYYSVLRLSPFFHIIQQKNAVFLYPLNEWIHHPLTYALGNFSGLWNWFTIYMTWPIIILIAGSFFIARMFWKEKVLALIWFAVPFIYAVLFGRVLYPRYILFMTLPLLPLAALVIVNIFTMIKSKYAVVIVIVLFLLSWCWADYFIINDFAHAPIPQSDLNQYVNDWPAGGGVREAVTFFNEKAKTGKIFIGTEGTFGLMPYAFEIYLVGNPNIKIDGFWPVKDFPSKDLVDASKKEPTYVVFYQPCSSCKSNGEAPVTWPVKQVASYRKGISNNFLTIYQLRP